MARLILFLLLLVAVALALAAALKLVWALYAAPSPVTSPTVTEDRMPNAIRNVAYVLLLLLLTGLTSGFLGSA